MQVLLDKGCRPTEFLQQIEIVEKPYSTKNKTPTNFLSHPSYPRLYVAKFLEVEENEEKGHVVILLQVDFKDGTLTNEVF